MRLLALSALVFSLFVGPSTGFCERPPLLVEAAGGLNVHMGVMETSSPNVTWKGQAPRPEDTHHLVFVFRNADTGRAENTSGIKLKVRAPSGSTIVNAPVKQFIAKGIASYGHFLSLKEEGKYEATVTFPHGGREHTVTFRFNK